ncbi:hypothetical protein [Pseudooceanicola sp. MF1-13]|uniref:hypothetical protein n=1 Tax=Pseudooceanicola sp. MF1-13 TaxID=3379095 RepID=UPI003891FC21
MNGLIIPFIVSLVAVMAGTLCQFKGSRYLLIGMGGLTAAAIAVLWAVNFAAGMIGCEGGTIRTMSCPEDHALTPVLFTLGKVAANLTLPGLVAGPVAAPFAALAEYWTRRNRKA